MQANVDKFKHFDIDASKQEMLIEIWKYYNPKDDPRPASRHSIYLNAKMPDVANHVFMEVLKYQVFDNMCAKIDRWQVRTQNILTACPVQLMYDKFIEVKSSREPRPKKSEESVEKPARRKKDSGNPS